VVNTSEYVYGTTLYLNNKYFLDDRDPNSYTNVSWIFGPHDRGWKEREVFGEVRCMSAGASSARPSPRSTARRWNAWSRRDESKRSDPGRGYAREVRRV
jgi:hypothetical protein